MDPGLRELAALSALAALGTGLAAAQGDFVFVALFGAADAQHRWLADYWEALGSAIWLPSPNWAQSEL
jgi:hypothetical protein